MLWKKVAIILLAMIFIPLLSAPVLTFANTTDSLKVSVFTFPTRIQEGNNATITLKLQQAESNEIYTFQISVTNPTGTFSAMNISVATNATGFGSVSTEYWGNFTEANTNYVGAYFVAVQNVTTNETLATTSFAVGLTDKLKYTRNETVIIKGSGYASNESVTINIKLDEEDVVRQNITASVLGVINYTWLIPGNATPGIYTVSIANATLGTVKSPPDVQEFYVEVWQVQIWARNLANEPVVGLTIKAYNNTMVPAQFQNLTQLTNETGWSSFLLATGDYTFEAFWKQVKAGNLSLISITNDTVSEEERWVQLSNLEITAIEEATNKTLPFVQLRLEYNYTIDIVETTETNLSGIALLENLFANANYTVKAKRYGLSLPPFQVEILPLSSNKITVKFPTYTLFVHVEDSKRSSAEGVKVEVYEWLSGLTQPVQSSITDPSGNVTFSLTFGRYRVRVYNDIFLLNETIVDLTQNKSSFLVYLSIYKINFTVAVVDYFGQPVPNAMVKIERKTGTTYQETVSPGFTGPDGHVTFSNALGGDSRISIYIGGQLSGTKDLYLTNSKRVTFNLNRYVVVIGSAMETSQFVTAVALALLIITFVVALSYKRLLKLFMKGKGSA